MKLATKTKKLFILLAPLVVYAVIAAVMVGMHFANSQPAAADAGPETSAPQGDYEFVFTGTVETATGRTFTLDMTGNKDEEQTLNLTVKEMPALNLTGTWTFTEGKGYKIFLDDANGTFAYSRYNPDTKSYSLTFDYDMGNFGQPRVVLTYLDEDFAAEYDGVGLGRKPPVFSLTGYTTYQHYGYGTLLCAEDGTVSASLTNTGAGWYFNRSGTWTYDEAADEYVIVFTDSTISLTDGNFDIHEDPAGDYILWTKFPVGAEEPEYGTHLLVSELQDTYQLFTDPYEYRAKYDEATDSYQIAIEAQYNWGLGHGDIVTFSGSASVADMEG